MAVNTRRYDVDWLRVLAMFAIFLFHCARFFNDEDWHVKNNQLDFGMSVFVAVLAQWIMPLFFVLSAMSMYYALDKATAGKFIRDRFKRLAIPFIFGTLVLIPPQVYIERVSHAQFVGSLLEFWPRYFDGFYAFGGNFAWMGLHLWYLEVLFVFSLVALPLFVYLKREPAKRIISSIAGRFMWPGAVFLLAVPLIVMELIVNPYPEGIGQRNFGGWSVMTYLVFFILGFLIASDDRFRQSIEKRRVAALAGGVVTTVAGYFLYQAGYGSEAWFALPRGLNSWLWLAAILGFGSRYLRSDNGFLRYAGEAVLPFYILHQTVIVVIGYYLADWNTSVMVKYLVLGTVSFTIIVVLYEFAVKRVGFLRFLFGMKPKRTTN